MFYNLTNPETRRKATVFATSEEAARSAAHPAWLTALIS